MIREVLQISVVTVVSVISLLSSIIDGVHFDTHTNSHVDRYFLQQNRLKR
jgi:hypothetical protein